MTTDIQNLKSFDPFAEVDDAGGEVKSTQQNYIHIRIQRTYLPPSALLPARCCPDAPSPMPARAAPFAAQQIVQG